MSIKSKILGLGAALALGLTIVQPAAAVTVGTVPVSVNVTEGGASVMSVALTTGTDTAFGDVPVNAVGTSAGLTPAGMVTFGLTVTGDTKLYRGGSAINVTLGNGAAANAQLNLNLTGGDPVFLGSDQVDFQIPGRYLSINAMTNPQQAKYSGSEFSTSGAQVWQGTFGRAPRVAGNAAVGKAIYKVGDIFGTFNSTAEGCKVVSDTVLVPWISSCGNAAFGEGQITKQIAGIYPGSGFVSSTQSIQLALNIPGGVYPGLYEGSLTVEQSFS